MKQQNWTGMAEESNVRTIVSFEISLDGVQDISVFVIRLSEATLEPSADGFEDSGDDVEKAEYRRHGCECFHDTSTV